jgi:hypothetical protein
VNAQIIAQESRVATLTLMFNRATPEQQPYVLPQLQAATSDYVGEMFAAIAHAARFIR